MKPLSIIGLLLTVLLLFGFQAETIVARPLLIALIAAPIVVQSYGIFFIAYGCGQSVEGPARGRRALRADRHVQLFRTGRGGCHRPVRIR